MFPIPFNFPFRKKDGSITTIGNAISEGGGGGGYTLPTASTETKGGIKVGNGLTMNGETLNNSNPTPYSLPTASTETKGGVKVGTGLTMDGETLNNSNPTPYTLPVASAEGLGGVKVGSGLAIDENGVLTATGGGSSDTGWTETTAVSGNKFEYRKINNIVFLRPKTNGTLNADSKAEVGRLPEGFRPSKLTTFVGNGGELFATSVQVLIYGDDYSTSGVRGKIFVKSSTANDLGNWCMSFPVDVVTKNATKTKNDK